MWSTKLTAFVSSASVTILYLLVFLVVCIVKLLYLFCPEWCNKWYVKFYYRFCVWIKHQKKKNVTKDNERTNWNKCEYYKSVIVVLCSVHIIIGTHSIGKNIEKDENKEDRERKTSLHSFFVCLGHQFVQYALYYIIILKNERKEETLKYW